ncbi:MAG: hypothetical protein AAGJ18_07340 [Bacteroidota bacterium]
MKNYWIASIRQPSLLQRCSDISPIRNIFNVATPYTEEEGDGLNEPLYSSYKVVIDEICGCVGKKFGLIDIYWSQAFKFQMHKINTSSIFIEKIVDLLFL